MGNGAFAATLRDSIAVKLRERILSGEFPQDSKLDIDELAGDFGASRTPVREALIELSQLGLVEIIPRRGIRVSGMSPEKISDTFGVFGGISGLATEWATRSADDEFVARLRKISEDFRRGDDEGIMENWALHREINRACGSPRLIELIRQLSGAMPADFFRLFPEQTQVSQDEHDAIIDAIEARDAKLARDLAEQHIYGAGARMIQRMEARMQAEKPVDPDSPFGA